MTFFNVLKNDTSGKSIICHTFFYKHTCTRTCKHTDHTPHTNRLLPHLHLLKIISIYIQGQPVGVCVCLKCHNSLTVCPFFPAFCLPSLMAFVMGMTQACLCARVCALSRVLAVSCLSLSRAMASSLKQHPLFLGTIVCLLM